MEGCAGYFFAFPSGNCTITPILSTAEKLPNDATYYQHLCVRFVCHFPIDFCFLSRDGVHLSAEGSKVVVEEILKVLKEAEWEPCFHWKSMATEYGENSPYDLVAADGKTTINPSEWTFHREIQWD